MFGSIPAGVELDWTGFVPGAAFRPLLPYGFQKFPPVTSAISML